MKPVVIIDAFIENKKQENLLDNFLNSICGIYDIFLISNTKISQDILDKVNYFFYDKKNNLFKNEYDNYEGFYMWYTLDRFKIFTHAEHKQKHGLSVLINLFRSLEFAKELEYTHFIRLEGDAILGEKTIQEFKNFFNELKVNNKKLKFYLNENTNSHSFQFFGGEINTFLKNFTKIKKEEDYLYFINQNYGNNDFITVEKLMFDSIKKIPNDDVIIEDDLILVLTDTVWNQSTSNAHLDEHMKKCQTDLYKVKNDNRLILYSRSNSDGRMSRKVVLKTKNSEIIFDYQINNLGDWFINYIDEEITHMILYDNNHIVYEKEIREIKNYIELL